MATPTSSRSWINVLATGFFISLSVLAVKEMHLSKPAVAVREPIQAIISSLYFPDQDNSLRETYTGIPYVDLVFRNIVAAFLPGVAGWDSSFQIQQIYFLFSFFPVVAIMAIEAGRKNASGLVRRTSIWALFYQTVGGAVVFPLYFLAYFRESTPAGYWIPTSRQLSSSYTKALLPSLLIGYLLPTILMYLPFVDPDQEIHQILIALWQPCPAFVSLLLVTISTAYGEGPATSREAASTAGNNMKHLHRVYTTSFMVSAAAHVLTIMACRSSSDPSVSFFKTIVRVPVGGYSISMVEGLRYMFQVDFWILFSAPVMAVYLNFWQLKRMGKINLSLNGIIIRMAVALVCVGPGATVAGGWYICEDVMTEKDKRKT